MPKAYRQMGPAILVLLTASAIGLHGQRTMADDTAASVLLAQSDAPPVYKPPMRGAPQGRVGGASRGARPDSLKLDVLAPDHVGLTTQEQPTLYWFVSQPVNERAYLTITAPDTEKPLIETALPRPLTPGINGYSLTAAKVRLQPDAEYEWSVAIVPDAAERSRDIVAGGIIRRVAATNAPEPFTATARSAGAFASAGYWYDAIDALSRAIERAPQDTLLRRDRAALLAQVGLTEAARYDDGSAR